MSKPRRHHFVPRFYLRGFAHDGLIGVVLLRERKRFVTSVQDAAVETDFYLVETEDGPSVEVETMLSKIEGAAASAIRRLVTDGLPLPEEERADLAIFLGFQAVRDRRMRDFDAAVTEFISKAALVAASDSTIRAALEEELGRPPTEREVAETRAFLQAHERYRVRPHPNQSIRFMLELAEVAAAMVAARTWQLLRFEGACLITSDVPVAMFSQQPSFFGVGIGTADELRFPVDRSHALVLAWDAPLGEVTRAGTPDQAKVINRSMTASAYTAVFHHPDDDPFPDGDLPATRSALTTSGLTLDDIAQMRGERDLRPAGLLDEPVEQREVT